LQAEPREPGTPRSCAPPTQDSFTGVDVGCCCEVTLIGSLGTGLWSRVVPVDPRACRLRHALRVEGASDHSVDAAMESV
jgi:hypothetical protein